MSDTSNVKFIEFHQPALESGTYKVTVEQDVSATGIPQQNYGAEQVFFVGGERFQILPTQIAGVFPPHLSVGDHSNVFPHLMISRNTLPWEREAVSGNPEIPWMALLVVHSEEYSLVNSSSTTLGNLIAASQSPSFPGVALEPGQSATQKVTVLDVDGSLLDQILPDPNAMQYLSHVRQGLDDGLALADEGEDLAVLIANRLPEAGGNSTVYLISLEDRYDGQGNFIGWTNEEGKSIRFVQLYSWKFTCTDPDKDFPNLVYHLDNNQSSLRKGDTGTAAVDDFLKMGFYPLPHKLRQGGQTVSWYHGPLAPSSNGESIDFPAAGSDALMRYYPSVGMFDASYASAWELGRLLALQNTQFSTELYQWKRRYAQAGNAADQTAASGVAHLNGGNQDTSTEAMPATCLSWLDDLKKLKGVPFGYLVPDEELLPAESIRFFQVDNLWQESLLDGALSVGRVTSSDVDLDTDIYNTEESLSASTMTGFILRSEVVSGWPGMLIEGYSDTDGANSVKLSRRDLLSNNVMICLFDGDVQAVDFHLKPEVLHFGALAQGASSYIKNLRDGDGEENGPSISLPLNTKRAVDVSELLARIQNASDANPGLVEWPNRPTSADLALQMLEGIDRIRFQRKV
ncbi:MAG: hypothetical protein AAF998_03630 [Bacteroidota bacterium]